ncbi:hypothetical protein MSG28_008860 [Choristoneura fumiferana]|uniref:Uncharacterized protein n=1 Tax=Choristoneura fumiferana TaxID=7141 RepID=A0ACC0J897_CHOFU|nr:hypothetical protein MSG28_008860 [Choristoneura fumiferana]
MRKFYLSETQARIDSKVEDFRKIENGFHIRKICWKFGNFVTRALVFKTKGFLRSKSYGKKKLKAVGKPVLQRWMNS